MALDYYMFSLWFLLASQILFSSLGDAAMLRKTAPPFYCAACSQDRIGHSSVFVALIRLGT